MIEQLFIMRGQEQTGDEQQRLKTDEVKKSKTIKRKSYVLIKDSLQEYPYPSVYCPDKSSYRNLQGRFVWVY